MALNIVARKVEVAKANNGGVLKYRAMTDIVNSMKPTLPWLTQRMLRSHINKLNKEKMKRDSPRPPIAAFPTRRPWRIKFNPLNIDT